METIGIIIYETVTDTHELADILREIADLITDGMTSSSQPGWEITYEAARGVDCGQQCDTCGAAQGQPCHRVYEDPDDFPAGVHEGRRA